MTYLAEPRPLLPEQCGIGDATGVHAAERDTGALVVSPVQFRYRHHVANLGILVCLRAEEGLAIGHGDGPGRAILEALEIAKIRLGVYQSSACIVRVVRWIMKKGDGGVCGGKHGLVEILPIGK